MTEQDTTTESEPTPGPWKVDEPVGRKEVVNGHRVDVVATEDYPARGGTVVAYVPTLEPDARLIAAAPDLRDALEHAYKALGRASRELPSKDPEGVPRFAAEMEEAYDALQAAGVDVDA